MYYNPINYKTFGQGKKFVLFLHGWGGSTNSFLSVANKISKYRKVVLMDFYGFGKSKFPEKVLDTYEYAISVGLFLHKKGIKELDIVAHSFGGRIAIILSSMFNVKVNNLFLVNSAGILPKRTFSYRFNVVKYKIYKNLVKHKIISKDRLASFGSDEYKQLDILQKKSYVKIVNQGLEYLLKYIKSKTVIVWGSNDNTTPICMAHRLKRCINNSTLLIYEGAGHFCYLENYISFCNLIVSTLRED